MKHYWYVIILLFTLTWCNYNSGESFAKFFSDIKGLDYSSFRNVSLSPRGEGEMIKLDENKKVYQVIWNESLNKIYSIFNRVDDTTSINLTQAELERIEKCERFYHSHLYDNVGIKGDSIGNIEMNVSKWAYKTSHLLKLNGNLPNNPLYKKSKNYKHLNRDWYYYIEYGDKWGAKWSFIKLILPVFLIIAILGFTLYWFFKFGRIKSKI